MRGPSGHDHGTDVRSLENTERGVSEVVGAFHQFKIEAKVGFVAAKPGHGIAVGHAVNGPVNLVPDELPQGTDHRFADIDDVILLNETHLDIKLSELGLSVGTKIFIAVTARDLEVTFHARDHQQLLE